MENYTYNREQRRKALRMARKKSGPQNGLIRHIACLGHIEGLLALQSKAVREYGLPPGDKRVAAAHEAGHIVVSMAMGGVFNRWLCFLPERQAQYKAAREKAAQVIAEQAIQIADDATLENLEAARLRIDGRVKLAERYAPRGFGEKQSGGDSEKITLETLQVRTEKHSDA